MIKIFFGDVRNGRLMRLPYFSFSLMLVLLTIGFGIINDLVVKTAGYYQQTQHKPLEWLVMLFSIVAIATFIMLVFAGMNIMAKRIRDVGLPGWWVILTIVALQFFIYSNFSEQIGGGLYTLIWFLLIIMPTNSFKE